MAAFGLHGRPLYVPLTQRLRHVQLSTLRAPLHDGCACAGDEL
jgi:hypothetical protein